MNEVLAVVIATTPYILFAIGLAATLALSSTWVITNPHYWLFYAILAFTLPSLTAGDGADGSLLKQITWGGLFLLAGMQVFGFAHGRFAMPTAAAPPYSLLALIIFAAISIAWSPLPLTSLKRVIQIIGVIIVAMVVALHSLNSKGLRQQLVIPVFIFMVIGFIVSVFTPGFAFGNDGALRAISSHKNTWGQFSLLVAVIFLFTLLSSAKSYWFPLVGLIAAIISLYLSKSATSILAFCFIFILVVLNFASSKRLIGRMVIFLVLTCITGAILIFTIKNGELPFVWLYESIFRLTDRSQSLTGRTFLWQLMSNEILKHPLLGIGYGGFWVGLEGPSAFVISQLNWGPPTQAHSGYIDVLNEIGYVGSVLLTFALIVHAYKVSRLWILCKNGEAGFHAALLISVLFINYAESSLLRTTHLWWIILCASIVEVHALYKRSQVGDFPIATGKPLVARNQVMRNS